MLNESNNDIGFLDYIKDWTNKNPGKTVGIIVGLLLGIFLFTLGIVKTLLILLFMIIGYLFGRSRDENSSIIDEITKLIK